MLQKFIGAAVLRLFTTSPRMQGLVMLAVTSVALLAHLIARPFMSPTEKRHLQEHGTVPKSRGWCAADVQEGASSLLLVLQLIVGLAQLGDLAAISVFSAGVVVTTVGMGYSLVAQRKEKSAIELQME